MKLSYRRNRHPHVLPIARALFLSFVACSLAAQVNVHFPKRKPKATSDKNPPIEYIGILTQASADRAVIRMEDTRILEFKSSDKTQYFRKGGTVIRLADMHMGDQVVVEATKDDEGFLFTVSMTVIKDAPPESPRAAPPPHVEEEPAELPTTYRKPPPVVENDEDGPPTLKHGKPGRVVRREREEAEAPPPQPAVTFAPGVAPAPPPPAPNDELIQKVAEAAGQFTETLPNYLVQQFTTRSESESRKASWRALDIVSADVVYQDGKETYNNLKINGKAIKVKDMSEMKGSWSTGEFATTLADLFAPSTDAHFRLKSKSSVVSGVPNVVYDFYVNQPNSHWKTMMASQTAFPGYKGSVWIDPKTLRVFRIEMQSTGMPDEFPLEKVEWVVEYARVRLGTQQYVVPSMAENLACFRGSFACVKNEINFRNYKRFSSESQIFTSDSNVNFEEDKTAAKPEEPKPAPPKSKKP